MHGSLAAEQLGPGLIHESDPDRVHPDLRAPPADPEHQMGPGVDGGKSPYPHMLEKTEDR